MNDTLPTVLTRFGHDLEHAITRELSGPQPTPPPPRRRRRILGGALAGCAVAGAAAAAVVLVATGSNSTNSRWDRHVLRAADIALPKPAPGTILHLSVTQTMSPGARGNNALRVPKLDAEGWFEQGAPDRSLTREQVPGEQPTWQTDAGLYDPATRRVYLSTRFPSSHPRLTLTRRHTGGGYELRIATAYGPVHETVTAAQARGLRTHTDAISWEAGLNASHKFFLYAGIVPRAQESAAGSAGPPSSTAPTFPAQLHRLLQAGNARVIGRTTVAGRAAIKIAVSHVSGYQRITYDVDPGTYQPIELDYYGISSKDLTRIVFHTYHQLPVKGNARVLRIPAPKGTRVDHNPAGIFEHTPPQLFW